MPNAWTFETDIINPYAWSKSFLTKEECKIITEYGKNKLNLNQGAVGKELEISKKIRDSNVSWIGLNEDTKWLYDRLVYNILKLNKEFFNFDIYGLMEGIQFTNYKAPKGKYTKHTDMGFGGIVRKLSVSIQLTDPKKYEGGELILHLDDKPKILSKEQGMLYIFPSWTLHEVKPVIKGERNSLVAWVNGHGFK